MYGENGEVEYGGDMKNAYKPTRTILDYKKHYFSNISVSDWVRYGLTKKTINPYKAPSRQVLTKKKIEMHFLDIIIVGTHKKIFTMHQKILILRLVLKGLRAPILNMRV